MPLSLLEACSGDELGRLMVAEFVQEDPIFQRLTWSNVDGTEYTYSQTVELGSASMRGLNETITGSNSKEMSFTENRRFFSELMKIDRQIVAGDPNRRTKEEFRKLQAMKERWLRLFFKGSSKQNPKEFDGLQARASEPQLDGSPSRKTIVNAPAGGVLSLRMLNAAIRNTRGNAILMSEDLLDWLSAATQTGILKGSVLYRQDDFGNSTAYYGSLPIIPIGRDSNEINFLDASEISPDGVSANDCTSVYVVGFGEGKLQGLNFKGVAGKYGFDVSDQGEVGTDLYTLIEWPCSIVAESRKCLTRLSGVRLGPIAS
jgi:hypothetical protein